MITGLFRILIGFILACLAAAVVQVGFVEPPADVVNYTSDGWRRVGELVLTTATYIAVFAAPFALAAVLVAEIFGVRGAVYHAISGALIAAAAFGVLLSGETPNGQTLVNGYAISAFLTTGLFGGLMYWLCSGRLSGGRRATRRVIALRNADYQATSIPQPAAKSKSAPPAQEPAGASGRQQQAPVSSVPSSGQSPQAARISAAPKPGSASKSDA